VNWFVKISEVRLAKQAADLVAKHLSSTPTGSLTQRDSMPSTQTTEGFVVPNNTPTFNDVLRRNSVRANSDINKGSTGNGLYLGQDRSFDMDWETERGDPKAGITDSYDINNTTHSGPIITQHRDRSVRGMVDDSLKARGIDPTRSGYVRGSTYQRGNADAASIMSGMGTGAYETVAQHVDNLEKATLESAQRSNAATQDISNSGDRAVYESRDNNWEDLRAKLTASRQRWVELDAKHKADMARADEALMASRNGRSDFNSRIDGLEDRITRANKAITTQDSSLLGPKT
jgi:hypothetical protein